MHPRLYIGVKRPLDGSNKVERLELPAHHLVTHGVVVGMTGSGKTGLVTVLIPEHAIGFRQDVRPTQLAAEQAVDQRRFAGVHLAADDEEEGRAQTAGDFVKRQVVPAIHADLAGQRVDATHDRGQTFTRREVALAEHGPGPGLRI